MTKVSTGMLGIAAVLAVLALLFLFMAWGRSRMKSNLKNGLFYYTSHRVGNAIPSLQAALRADPLNPWARELLAKIEAESGSLNGAEENYQTLLSQGFDRPTVHVGLGVTYLRMAERAKTPEEMGKHLVKARAAFQKGGSVPEAKIGLAHTFLLEGVQKGSDSLIGQARQKFEEVRGDLSKGKSQRARITRDGLIDYYAGIGRATASSETYSEDASNYFQAAQTLAPGWESVIANYLLLEAQRFASTDFDSTWLMERKTELFKMLAKYKTMWSGNVKQYGGLKLPWLQLKLAVAYAFALENQNQIYRQQTYGLDRQFPDSISPVLCDLAVLTGGFQAPGLSRRDRTKSADAERAVLETVLKRRALHLPEHAETLQLVYNNKGVVMEYLGRKGSRQLTSQGVDSFKKALNLNKEDYYANRNLAVLLHRSGQAKEAVKYRKAAEAAAEGEDASQEIQDDIEKVREFFGKP